MKLFSEKNERAMFIQQGKPLSSSEEQQLSIREDKDIFFILIIEMKWV
jgi:hypothetical protein